MAQNFGTGVSRVLDPQQGQITQVIWQEGKPPLDSELNLLQQLATDARQIIVSRGTPSGWLGNETDSEEVYETDADWSNWFRFGQQRTGEKAAIQWAVVNGWMIPVTGTLTGSPPGSPDDDSTWNRVTLDPPPSNSGDSRIDFVFLEVWQARIPPNPSTLNKPSASALYRYGNVEGGFSFLSDDLQDPNIGFETTQRAQLQYRIRVVTGLVGLTSYPDGFDPAVVKAQGAATTETSFTFTNMRSELGDPGLWRAGDGAANALGTVDGYVYAIPIAVVFRRNSVAWDGDPGQNLNGGFNRNPTAVDRTGYATFTTVPTITADISDSATTLTLSSVSNIALPTSPASPVYVKIGDEVLTYTSITGTTMNISDRGVLGTKAEAHLAGDSVDLVSTRPDGLFSDQVAKSDILDLRHVVNPNGFDYDTLLKGALDSLMRGNLQSNWKRSGAGPQSSAALFYQDVVTAGSVALGVTQLDAPDNVRQIFSDSSVLQPVEFVATPPTGVGVTEDISTAWSLTLGGTINNSVASTFSSGDVITIPIAQLKNSVPGSDADQVQFPALDNTVTEWVRVRKNGEATFLIPGTDFTVAVPATPSDDLVITLAAGAATSETLFITFHVQYGPGRGISRRPDAVHSVSHLSVPSGVLSRQKNIPANNTPSSVGWAPLWSKVRNSTLANQIPVTAESYVDPGSRTLVLSPFRRVSLFAEPLKAIKNNNQHGAGVGLMPAAGSDPLELFSGTNDGTATRSNTYVVIPRNLMPGWGAVHVPMRHTDTTDFSEGINFGFYTGTGTPATTDQDYSFIAYADNGGPTYSELATHDPATGTVIPYNTLLTSGGRRFGGARFFTDTRGLGRRGLELPPYYVPARLFAVYERVDYADNGSSYSDIDRLPTGGGATNLLRQDFDGPVFWIEQDSNSDPTVILNADALDITKSPNTIASFEDGEYVILASLFGVDRGAFDLNDECRVVLTRARTAALDVGASDDAVPVNGVDMVVPAPPSTSHDIAINYSRVPYQADSWGSQTVQTDIPPKVGPLDSATAHQISSTVLDSSNLTRPNEQVLEVLSGIGFLTTLGTGRWSGDSILAGGVGYEDPSNYPPATAFDDRPGLLMGALSAEEAANIKFGTSFHGCTERLPLGSLFRDHHFRGGSVIGDAVGNRQPLVYVSDHTPGTFLAGLQVNSSGQSEVNVNTISVASGQPQEIIAFVDGESGNYSLTTNYRTNRGGSLFVTGGSRPGGEIGCQYMDAGVSASESYVLVGRAMLVRNTPTNIGATEVSAGSELMMVIVTTVKRLDTSDPTTLDTLIGTNGTREGYSAADLYRLPGRPLVRDHVRVNVDPSSVSLSQRLDI